MSTYREHQLFLRWGDDVAYLKRGTRGWNALRRLYKGYVPQLSGADLEGLDLRGADLKGADLRGAYLSFAKLREADLRGADLRRAFLAEADLTGANLRGANLRHADLHGSSLADAKLEGAILTDTILDPHRWVGALLELWEEAAPARRRHLIEVLRNKTVLRRGWRNETAACPEAILSDRGYETDDLMDAWNTGGIREEQLLEMLEDASPLVMAAGASLV
jgi:hypothetical protein